MDWENEAGWLAYESYQQDSRITEALSHPGTQGIHCHWGSGPRCIASQAIGYAQETECFR